MQIFLSQNTVLFWSHQADDYSTYLSCVWFFGGNKGGMEEGVKIDDIDIPGLSQAKSFRSCPACLDVYRPSDPE